MYNAASQPCQGGLKHIVHKKVMEKHRSNAAKPVGIIQQHIEKGKLREAGLLKGAVKPVSLGLPAENIFPIFSFYCTNRIGNSIIHQGSHCLPAPQNVPEHFIARRARRFYVVENIAAV